MVSSFLREPQTFPNPHNHRHQPTKKKTTWTSIVSSVGKDWSWWIHIDRTLEKSEPVAQGRIFCQVIQAAVTCTSSAIIGGQVSWKKGSLKHLKKVTKNCQVLFFCLDGKNDVHFKSFFQNKNYYPPGNDHISHPKAFGKTSLLSHWWDLSVSSLEGMLESESQQFQG